MSITEQHTDTVVEGRATANAERPATTGEWTADRIHSSVGFEVKYMLVSTFRGEFEDFEATLTFEDGEPRLTGVVDAGSIKVRDENLAAHLQSPEFFDSARHPQIRFETVSAQQHGSELAVEGDLTIRGVTRRVHGTGSIAAPHEDPYGGMRVGVELSTVVNRKAYGMEWNMALPKGGFALADEVTLVVHLQLVRAD